MKKSLLILLSITLTLLLFSCATGKEAPRAEIGGEITLIGTTPGLGVEVVIPFDSSTEKVITEEPEPTVIEKEVIIEEIKEETPEVSKPEETPETPSPIEETVAEEVKEEEKTVKPDETKEEIEVIEEVKEETTPQVVEFSPVDTSDIISAFNYAYGLKTMDDIKSENISLNAKYFARAVIDASKGAVPELIATREIQTTIDKFVLEYYYEGKTFLPGERPENITELLSLEKPSNLEESFSYAYTFSIIRELIDGEVDIMAEPFILGALDSLLNSERLFDKTEEERAINAYITYLNEQYLKEIEEKGETNSDRANVFLDKNALRDEITVLDNGIQIEILDEDETLGDHPTQYDTVLVDYNMYVMDYETEDLEIIDADYYAELRLMEIDTALQSSIVALRVGQAGRAWIPPEMLYEDRNIDGIEPNSIIVYDIALHGII